MKKMLFICCCVSILLFSCGKNSSSNSAAATTSSQVPGVAVNTSININSVSYTALKTVGGSLYLANVGYRGILLYRLNSSTIMAYDRTCTYDISDAGGIVYVQNDGTAACLDCGSAYLLTNGNVSIGPSTIGLKTYVVNFNTSSGAVTVTN